MSSRKLLFTAGPARIRAAFHRLDLLEGDVPIKIRLRHLAGKTLYLGTHGTSNNAQGIEREII